MPSRHHMVAVSWILLASLFAGCLSGAPGPVADVDDGGADEATDDGAGPADRFEATLPTLAPGTTFTYRYDGPWALQDRFTVVVTTTSDGYLFAGATEQDLYQHVLEGTRLFGHRDAALNRVDDTGARLEKTFSFPLHDGKNWTDEGRSWHVQEAEVTTPGGTERGFRIHGIGPERTWVFDYAPSLGMVTHGAETHTERGALWQATLASAGTATEAVWFAYTAWAWTGMHTNATTLDIGEETEAVLVEAYGDTGTRGWIRAPTRAPAVYEGSEGTIHVATHPGETGTWTLGSATAPGSSYALWAIGVDWRPVDLA